ncbi:RNA polymerase sigma factor [Novosphingobium sp. FKTRR1]|uniref:RNA polymerase sigma factor n=1 Tax=Novosphingobium sp. FKTRR1 TaxID=2879118 RepID=UPI001CF0522A|nr:RNA polymerase sigma factor [Novosphingobium sp. FKTRR1]
MTFYGELAGEAALVRDEPVLADETGWLSDQPFDSRHHSLALAPAHAGSRAAASGMQSPVAAIDCGSLDDTALMAAVAHGGVDAFAVLVERHTASLYRVAMRMLNDTHEAEDVVQDCFVRMWQHAPRWKPSGAGLVGWLHRVAMNLCFDRKRRFRVITTPDLPDSADDAPLADSVMEADQAHRAVRAALDDLPERYRAALVLCYYEGFTNALAADVMGLNIKAMESLLFRARRQLRDRLEAHDVALRDVTTHAGLLA